MDRPDTDFYMYSLGGFAPCYFYDMTQKYTFEMLIQCAVLVDTTNLTGPSPVSTDSLKVGYQYRDVVVRPNDKDTEFILGAPWSPDLTIKFSLRDMKYLSNANNSFITTTDVDVMSGTKPISMELNFNDLLEQDASGETYFIVGGRVYYEITVSGTSTISFISKGFFDQEGYQMPAAHASSKNVIIGISVTIGVLLLLALICYCYKRRQDEINKIKGVVTEQDV